MIFALEKKASFRERRRRFFQTSKETVFFSGKNLNEKNAEAALRALMFQYRIGNREALDSKASGFIPFTGDGADLKKKAVLERANAEVMAVFENIK